MSEPSKTMTETRTDDDHSTSSPKQQQHVIIHDKSGLYIAVLAIVLSCLSLGMLAMLPTIIDSKVQAGMAKAEATANVGREHARIALDKVEQTQTQLGAKGLIKVETH